MERVPLDCIAMLCGQIIFGCIVLLNASANSSLISRNFQKLSSSGYGATHLGTAWTSPSLATCVLECFHRYPGTCKSVIYHHDLHLCTPGSQASLTLSAPDAATEGELFGTPPYCNTVDDFSLVTSAEGTSACLKLLQAQTYDEGAAECASLGGYLAVARTDDKLYLLNDFSSGYAFLGLDDKTSEGTFVWADNGQVITAEEAQIIYLQGEPYDNDGDEDCTVGFVFGKVYDGFCSYEVPAVCERSMT